ncbi:MAG TPA: hypothetical protein VG389_05085 [Myxococcota bacterium]|jgi:hypothetical protein|nr:hypothetical protein [Myxococcota bacterium]
MAAPRIDLTTARLPFVAGQGPFRARGVVYLASIAYVKRRTPGGMPALLASLEDPADRTFLSEIFLAGSMYDIAPLVRLTLAAARLEGTPAERFVKARGTESADTDIRGIYRVLIWASSPEGVAVRLPRAFNRYFEPARSEPAVVRAGHLDSALAGLPEALAGWYVAATEGFVQRALEMAGARDVRFNWDRALPHGATSGVPTVRVGFEIDWR